MKKFWIGTVFLLLAGCQASEDLKEQEGLKSEQQPRQEVQLPKNKKEWLKLEEQSSWYKSQLHPDAEPQEQMLADLTGDEIPEVILPYLLPGQTDGQSFGLLLGKFNKQQNDWDPFEGYINQESRLHINTLKYVGKLQTPDEKDLLVMNEQVANAGSYTNLLHVFQMGQDEQNLVQSAEFAADYEGIIKIQDNQLFF